MQNVSWLDEKNVEMNSWTVIWKDPSVWCCEYCNYHVQKNYCDFVYGVIWPQTCHALVMYCTALFARVVTRCGMVTVAVYSVKVCAHPCSYDMNTKWQCPPQWPQLWARGRYHVPQNVFLVFDFCYSAQCWHCKRCTSYGNSVCPSVCHTPVLCQNDCT